MAQEPTDQNNKEVDLTATEYPNLSALAYGMVTGRISEWPQLKEEARKFIAFHAALMATPPSALEEENAKLRELLWVAHGKGYGDDGELQNSLCHPSIDFKRDSAKDIEAKLIRRNFEFCGIPMHRGPISQEHIDAYYKAFSMPNPARFPTSTNGTKKE